MTNKELAWMFEKIKTKKNSKERQRILLNHQCYELKEVLKFLYDDRISTGMDMARLTGYLPGENPMFKDASLVEVMAYVKEHNTGKVQDVLAVRDYIAQEPEYVPRLFLKQLFTKTVRAGMTAKTVNKVFPGLIYQHDIQQGFSYDQHPIKDGTYFYLAEKLSGPRITVMNGIPLSRTGKVISGIDYIMSDLKELGLEDWFVDGELIRDNVDGIGANENYRKTMSLVMSKAEDKPGLKMVIFDMFPMRQLSAGHSTWLYAERKKTMLKLKERLRPEHHVEVVDFLYEGTDQSVIQPLLDRMNAENKDGMMMNLNVPYLCKKHKGCLKIETFPTIDLMVLGMEEGAGEFSGTLGALKVEYKNKLLNIGRGFSREERDAIWKGELPVIGKIIKVKYKCESKAESTGYASLHLATFVGIREDKTEESCE